MPSAEIITIGTEILLGDILDTNARFAARALRDAGIDLYRKTSVGDNNQRIAQAIQQAMERCDIVITTGGLGPTVDDPTRDAVALAFGVKTEFCPELWEQIQQRFKRYNREPTENNRRQAYIPVGATAIENPVGTAPSFYLERDQKVIISLPGVPREMEYLMEHAVIPYLRQRYALTGLIKTRVIHTAGAGESHIDDLIGDLEQMSNPTVGLAAHSGQVDIRITVKAVSNEDAEALMAPVEETVRNRLGKWIYGADEESLEQVVLRRLQQNGWQLAIVEAGLNGELVSQLAGKSDLFLGGEVLPHSLAPDELHERLERFCRERGAQLGLGAAIYPGQEKQDVTICLIAPGVDQQTTHSYGGPRENTPRWALNQGLNLLRDL